MTADHHDASAGGDDLSLGKLKEQAGEKVSQVADSLKQEAAKREEGMRGSLSKQADELASALRSARSDIDPESGIGKMFDYAADSVGSIARNLKTADTAELVDNVRSFARERPGAFLGICALGGFGAARFLLAGAPASGRGSTYGGSQSRTGSYSGSTGRTGTTLASQSQGGSASLYGQGTSQPSQASGSGGSSTGAATGTGGGSGGSSMSGSSGAMGSGIGGSSLGGSGGLGGSGTGGSAGSSTGSGTGGSAGSSTGSGAGGDLPRGVPTDNRTSGAESARVPGYGNSPGTSSTGGGHD